MYSYQALIDQALIDQALVMQLQLASYHGSKKQTREFLWITLNGLI